MYMQNCIHVLFAVRDFIFCPGGVCKNCCCIIFLSQNRLFSSLHLICGFCLALAWQFGSHCLPCQQPVFSHLVNLRKAGNCLGFHFLLLSQSRLPGVQGAASRSAYQAEQADIQTKYFDGFLKIVFRIKLLICRGAKCGPEEKQVVELWSWCVEWGWTLKLKDLQINGRQLSTNRCKDEWSLS